MLVDISTKLNSLSPDTKRIILKTTMILLLAFGFLIIFLSTFRLPARARSDQYRDYLQNYSRQYSPEQQRYREFLFYQTYDNVIFNNKQLDSKFSEGLNKFTDLSEEEFQQLYLIITTIAKSQGFLEIAEFQNNYYFDWAPFLPPPKNMRDYDASHIFSVVAALQFQVNKREVLLAREENRTYDLQSNWITLAEQEVIDCCANCIGKKQPKDIYYHLGTAGISRDANYSYVNSIYNRDPRPCQTLNQTRPYRIEQYGQISSCRGLIDRLQLSPVVVFVDARKWRSYTGGIFEGCETKRNHYALVVGRGIGYWKIRNSWGVHWGEHGHIRIKSGNTCGVCGRGSYIEL